MRRRPFQIHLENFTSKPLIFHLTPDLIAALRARHPGADGLARFTHGENLVGLAGRLRETEVLVTSTDVLRHADFPKRDLAAAAPRLRLIHLIGAGIEGAMPLDWLPPGTVLTNNSGVHAAKIGEFFLMALVALNNRLPAMVTNQRAARWDAIFTPRIAGRRVTVIGLGDIGGAAVWAARILGMTVTGVRRSAGTVRGVDRVHPPAEIAVAVADADIVAVATPLTPETRGLVSDAVMRAMKPGVGIVNVGRAAVMDYPALVRHLESGHVGGAILDVFDPEPLPADSLLWSAPNLIISPHVSSDDLDAYMHDTMDLVWRNIRRLRAGRKLLNRVDPARQY